MKLMRDLCHELSESAPIVCFIDEAEKILAQTKTMIIAPRMLAVTLLKVFFCNLLKRMTRVCSLCLHRTILMLSPALAGPFRRAVFH